MHEVFIYWHCRYVTPKEIILFGSWDDCTRGIPLEFNQNSMFGTTVEISAIGKFYYYFVVDGDRKTDWTKPVITITSEEFNQVTLPLRDDDRGLLHISCPIQL